MFESVGAVATADLRGLLTALTRVQSAVDDTERVDQLDLLERLKAVAAAAQARITVDLVESQEQMADAARARARAAADAGDFETWRAERDAARAASCEETPASETGRRGRRRPRTDVGVQAQVALARRVSPAAGSRHVCTARALVRHMPQALAALEAGVLSERRADLLVQETAILTAEQRGLVDAELGTRWGGELEGLGDRELVRRVKAVCYRIDAQSVVARALQAESDRRVSLRPAPDTMSYLTALLPVAQGLPCSPR